MKKEEYLMFREAALLNSKGECVRKIQRKISLDYRTVRTLVKIINNESNVSNEDINMYTDKNFYTLENVVELAAQGLNDLIPASYYESSLFLRLTGIDSLPDMFLAGDEERTEFTVAPEIKHIGYGAFMNCRNLRVVRFNGAVQTVGDNAFKGTTYLNDIRIPDSCISIGSHAFEDSGLRTFVIPKQITELKEAAFKNCSRLGAVFASHNNPVDVANDCFIGCKYLETADFLVGNVGRRSFCKCVVLEDIKLSSAHIEDEAFAYCLALKNIRLADKTPVYIGEHAFTGCVSLNHVKSDGFSYELRECEGYDELTKMLRDNAVGMPDAKTMFEFDTPTAKAMGFLFL